MEISSPDAAATVGAPDPARGWPQGWNETTSDYERDSTIDDLVRARAQERPDAIAIVDGDATVTYVELVERADALAARVRPHLDGPDQCVGVVAERSSDAVVAFLGVLAAGAAFVPLEAGQPVERLRAMVRDTHARATVAPSHLLSRASEMGDLPVIELRDERAAEVEAPPWSRGGGALAYVMFTSGSTGRPKGVGAEHRGVLRYVRGARDLAPTVDDAVLHVGSIGFDASTYEIWGALCNGARLVVHPESRFDPREVAETITRHGVTVGMFSAGSLHLMVDGALASLGGYRLVISAGDVLSPAHAARLRQEWPATRLVNAYGPTEATVTASVFEVTSVTAGHSVPIGHPLANTTLYVLDGDRLVAPGEVGELCVGGEGVARGYVGLPELTAERFVADPFGPSGGRLYRTGDLVRLDGEELEFLGRRDDQVKIRGYLVEPAEVVAALSGCDGVAEAEVVSIETIPGHRRLVAYVTSDGRSEIDAARLRRDLARRLPDYLVPSRLEVVDALPQTELGKHDRAALAARARSALGHDPSAGAEALVAACWCAVLEVSDPGADDDFFESGGDSLLALALTAALDDACGVNLPLHVVFDERTIARLARRLDVGVVARDLPTIVARDESDDRRASMTQAQACFVADLADDALPYQSSASVSLEGPLVVDALVRALNALVARHDVLRARLPLEWGQRLLVVDDDATAALDAVDLSREPDADVAADVETTRRFRERIDPAVGPLVRWTLLTLAPGRHRLLQVEHHVAHDGWSFALLMGELVSLYRTEVAGLPSSLSPLTLSYADFAVWQNGFVDTDEGAAQAAYWRDELSRVAAPPSVATDRPHPVVRSYRGASLRRNLSPDLTDRIHRASARTAATPFQVTLAAFCVLLARLSDDDEIVVGSGLANRRRPEVAEVVGMMVNTVVIRADFGGNPTVADAIARVRTRVVGAMENQELPFEEVVRALDPPRRPGHLPYVDHLFSFHDTPFPSLDGGDVAVRVADTLSNGSAKADLNVVVVNRRGRDLGPSPEGVGLTVVWEYSSDVFDASTAEALLDAYVTLLDAMVDHLDEPIASLALTTQLDDAVDAPRLDYERDASIDEVFAQRAVEDSDALAVVAGAVTLTYGELNDASHRLARRLWTLGVEPGECIGVVDDRTASMVVSLLGVLRAGAAYVGIDPTAPPTRQARVRELAGVRVVLASEGGASRIEPGVDVVEVDARGFGRTRVRVSRPPTAPLNGNGPRSLAYVSFTSGSTGEPKGVEVAHRGVVRLARGARFVEWRRGDAVYAGAPLAFDASTFEIFGPLLNGARVVMAPPGPLSVAEIGDVLVEYGVTTAWFTAGLFHQLVDHGLARLTALRQILAGGDVLSTSHVNRLVRELRGDARFVAGYGPTEGTTFSCALVLSRGDEVEGTVPLGGPLDNTAVAVLDRAGHAVPSGLAGELWIGGDGVALGYVARPDLTAERFSSDVLDGRLGEWAYRTGDRVRRRGGSLEFLGRVDRQVKVRGFRVEPSEVEAALLRLAGVARAHVEPVAYGRDDRRLVAYVVSSPGDVVDPDRLTRALRDTLPAHMVPAVIVGVDELPLRANGKIDPTQLPEPPSTWFDEDPSNPLTPLTSVVAAPVAGASALENTLVALWQEVIGVRRIGLDDDFFDLGGHSLLAVELFAAIERATGARLRLATIFEAPTVARMAHVLRASGVDAEVGSLVALTTTGDRTPIFAVTAGDGNAVGFGPLARRLGSDQPFYVLQPRGLDGTAPLHRSVEAMAGFYVEEIRTVQPTGPYVLVGRCFGSLVAYEMARQLEATGEVVALLASIDSGGPLWQTRHLANGTDYDPTMNEARVRAHQDGIDFGDVFGDAVAADSFQQWLVEPATRVGDVDVSRYLHAAYLARPDVRAAYPLTGEGADPEGLLRWAWDSGRPEMGMQAALLAAADAVVGRKPRRTSKPRPERARRRAARGDGVAASPPTRVDEILAVAVDNAARYRAGPLNAPVTLVWSTGEHYAHQQIESAKWYGLEVEHLDERLVEGSHHGIMREPEVAGLAAVIAAAVDDAVARTS